MDEPWVILTRRYGGDVRNPTAEELALAIEELYVEDLQGMTEADYEEHGAAFLRNGFDDGPCTCSKSTQVGRSPWRNGRIRITRRHCLPHDRWRRSRRNGAGTLEMAGRRRD